MNGCKGHFKCRVERKVVKRNEKSQRDNTDKDGKMI